MSNRVTLSLLVAQHVLLFVIPGTVEHQAPWNSPEKNTGVGCHSCLQGIFPTQGSNSDFLHCRQILYLLSHQGSPIKQIGLYSEFLCRFFPIHLSPVRFNNSSMTGKILLWVDYNQWLTCLPVLSASIFYCLADPLKQVCFHFSGILTKINEKVISADVFICLSKGWIQE